MAGQPNPWKIPLGATTLEVSDLTMALGSDNVSGVSGSFAGTVAIGETWMHLGYDMPGDIDINAHLPEIKLTELFAQVAGVADTPLPTGFPDLVLRENTVGMTRQAAAQGSATYDFRLHTLVEINGTKGLNLAAHLLRSNGSTGMAVAVWTLQWPDGQGWSPGTLWKPLEALTFNSFGLVISSLPSDASQKNTLVPVGDVPAVAQDSFAVVHGVSMFASLTLHGDKMDLFRGILGDVTFDLYASYATPTKKTALIAHLDINRSAGAFEFKSFELIWGSTGTSNAAISAVAKGALHIDGENLDFTVAGGVSASGNARIALGVQNWEHPFGYQRLVVRDFSVAMAYDSGVIVEAQGSFGFETKRGKKFDFGVALAVIDFEAPSALACGLKTQNGDLITVGEVLEGITTIDVYDLPAGAELVPWVAQIKLLDLFLAFSDIKFWAVAADEVTINDVVYRSVWQTRHRLS